MIFLAYEGITSSIRTAMVLFTAEVVVVLVISHHHRAKGGAHGLTLQAAVARPRRRTGSAAW